MDEPLEVEDYAGTTAPGSGSLRSLLANRLGSIAVAVSVATGAVASEVEYDSFGQRSIVAGTSADLVRYGYTGREHDAETGLLYYRARHYDPATGTFLQQDPIGFAAGDPNLYAYVENDPFNATDPSGLTASASYGSLAGASLAAGAAACVATQPCRDVSRIGGLFSGVMALAGQINGALANLWQNTSDSGQTQGPGIGHNGGPRLNDPDPNGDGPDPLTPEELLLIAAGAGMAIDAIDGNVVVFAVPMQGGDVLVMGNLSQQGGTLIIDKPHVDGSAAGSVSLGEWSSIARSIGQAHGAKEVKITNAVRTYSDGTTRVVPDFTIRVR